MKIVRFKQYGGTEELEVAEAGPGEPAEGEVLVRVHSAGVNYLDCKVRAGLMQKVLSLELPVVPGAEIAGIVESVGEGVDRFRPGDTVFGQIAACVGGYSELALAKADHLAAKPAGLTFAQAASLPVSAATAWMAVETVEARPGLRLLIHGAGGGVGGFAVQFAALKGAHVIATASSNKAALVRAAGAAQVVEYDRARFEDSVEPVDAVLDFVGPEFIERSWAVLKPGGILASAAAPPDPSAAERSGAKAAFVILRPDGDRLARIAALIDSGDVVVSQPISFALEDAGLAHQLCETRHAPGRIVLAVDTGAGSGAN